MIRIRYSIGEVEIDGTSEDYQRLRDQLVEFVDSAEPVFSIVADSSLDPAPYESSLKQLVFIKSDSLLCDVKDGDLLKFIGFPAAFIALANNLPIQEGADVLSDDYHHHFDYIGQPQDVSIKCASMVLRLRANG